MIRKVFHFCRSDSRNGSDGLLRDGFFVWRESALSAGGGSGIYGMVGRSFFAQRECRDDQARRPRTRMMPE